ncbi:hypothetical protein, partial [Aeromonas salmonicida]|uniref:hypothetical protein n=1 Tax=Aeromonas salmonicida TaxID=645 RepID=UPI0019630251
TNYAHRRANQILWQCGKGRQGHRLQQGLLQRLEKEERRHCVPESGCAVCERKQGVLDFGFSHYANAEVDTKEAA